MQCILHIVLYDVMYMCIIVNVDLCGFEESDPRDMPTQSVCISNYITN